MTVSEDTVHAGDSINAIRSGKAIGAAAIVLMAANLSGSLLGYARIAVIVAVFGENRATDAFFAASIIPQMFYDLTIGAAVSAALIPIFTEISGKRGPKALVEVAGSVLGLAWVLLATVTVALVFAAHPLMVAILARNHSQLNAAGIDDAVRVVRVLVVTLFFLGTSAVLLSLLYSVRRFTVSGFAPGLYHIGIIVAALLLARPLGILALPIGAVAGAASQAAVQTPSLLRYVGRVRPRLRITPEVRHILRIYAPVAAGLLVSVAGQIIDLGFKWQLGSAGVTEMSNATVLTQFPIGIAVAGLSYAILPTISADAAFNRMADFKGTLASGMRLVLFLTIPAAIGYLALATPICALVFQHHKVTGGETHQTALALIGYAIQIPFVGLDQLLIFSFYARKNTVTPMLVGVLGVGVYVVTALILLPRLHILGLALANTTQNSVHALILLALLLGAIGSLRGTHLVRGVGKTLVAAGAMAIVVGLLSWVLQSEFSSGHLLVRALQVLVPMALGAALYLGVAGLLDSDELRIFRRMLAQRLGTQQPTPR